MFSSITDWLNSTAPTIIHREMLNRWSADSFITVGEIEAATARAATWVRRNLREWPYQHRLASRIEGDWMLFWFEKNEEYYSSQPAGIRW